MTLSRKKTRLLILALMAALGFVLVASWPGGRQPVALKPSTPAPSGTNWNFSLFAGGYALVIFRDGHTAEIVKADGNVETNSFDAGRRYRFIGPGETWEFGVYVPETATEIRVTVFPEMAPKSWLAGQPVEIANVPRSLSRVHDKLMAKFISPPWKRQEIRTSLWVKRSDQWVEKVE